MARRGMGPGVLAALLGLGLLLSLFAALAWGRYPDTGFLSLGELRDDPMARNLVFRLRLPRALMAICTGAVLAASGLVLQTVLGNPLVEPGLLGVSQGAAFGAGLAILTAGNGSWSIPVTATFFGLTGLVLSWILARKIRYGGSILRLLLAGIVVSAFFSSGLGILKFLADPRRELPEITFWLMGGLSSATWESLLRAAPVALVSGVVLLSVGWRINLLSLDDRSAFALGSRPGRDRAVLIVVSVVAVAVITAEVGIVSWVGLLVPHGARKLLGAEVSRSLPAAMLLGSVFVLVSDTFARTALTGEIPLGLITAMAGALLFSLLLTMKDLES